jgi:hypothetical protein
MKTYGESGGIAPRINPDTRWEWSASRLGRFISGIIAPGTHLIGCWMDIGNDLNVMAKRKTLITAIARN